MPFVTTARRALPVGFLFATYAFAASCWYPDGKTVSSDIPCSANSESSACCSSQSFCIAGGYCLTGAMVTRGSCTDKTWGSPECAGFCKDVSSDGEIAITPCSAGLSTNQFVCGLENDDCNDNSKTFQLSSDTKLVLRPAQIQAVAGNAIASGLVDAKTTLTATPAAADGYYPTGALVGAGAGVGIPLLIAFGIVLFLLVREKRKPRPQYHNNMYRIPDTYDDDDKGSIMIRPAPSMIKRGTTRSSHISTATSKLSRMDSDIGSFRQVRTASPKPIYIPSAEVQKAPSVRSPVQSIAESQRASHIPSLAERIETLKVTPQLVDVRDSGSSRHELDSTPSTPLQPSRTGSTEKYPASPKGIERYELATSRMSR